MGEESKSAHKEYLFRRIAWQMQAQAEGGLSARALGRIAEISDGFLSGVLKKKLGLPQKREDGERSYRSLQVAPHKTPPCPLRRAALLCSDTRYTRYSHGPMKKQSRAIPATTARSG
jgi:hypothetical protein